MSRRSMVIPFIYMVYVGKWITPSLVSGKSPGVYSKECQMNSSVQWQSPNGTTSAMWDTFHKKIKSVGNVWFLVLLVQQCLEPRTVIKQDIGGHQIKGNWSCPTFSWISKKFKCVFERCPTWLTCPICLSSTLVLVSILDLDTLIHLNKKTHTLSASYKLVSMTSSVIFSCHIILQKSDTHLSVGPERKS